MKENEKSKVYRILSNATDQTWDKISFWTKAEDVQIGTGTTSTTLDTKITNLESRISAIESALTKLKEKNLVNAELESNGTTLDLTKFNLDYTKP